MRQFRSIIVTLSWAAASASFAQWSPTNLHPPGAGASFIYSVSQDQEAGYMRVGNAYNACFWSGTGASAVNLAPGTGNSIALGVGGGVQVGGSIDFPNTAIAWQGTAASGTLLYDTRAEVRGTTGAQHIGTIFLSESHAYLWNAIGPDVDLNPPGARSSFATAICSTMQGGQAYFHPGTYHAGIWRGTADSWVDLHPAAQSTSVIYGVCDSAQVGSTYNRYTVKDHAALWYGTAASWVDLHPYGTTYNSWARGVANGVQVGYATFYSTGDEHAIMWTGSASSWIDLHSFLSSDYSKSDAWSVWTDGVTIKVGGGAYNTVTNRWEAIVWSGPFPTENFDLTLNKATVAGENYVMGTITMEQTRPRPITFNIYDDSSLVTTPGDVSVATGQSQRNFQIKVTATISPIATTIYAKRGTIVRSKPLLLTPLVPTALAFTPSQVQGGQGVVGRVVINGVAGPNGRTIAIFDNSGYATVPSTVVVPPGGSDVSFPIETRSVPAVQTVTVTARVSAGEKSGTFRIVP